MPQMPCYNSIAADRYADECGREEERLMAIDDHADFLANTLNVDHFRSRLLPHEQETLDEWLMRIAEKELTSEAEDNFIEPDPPWI